MKEIYQQTAEEVLERVESSPKGDLRLTVTNITTDQPVHDLSAFHVLFHCLNGI